MNRTQKVLLAVLALAAGFVLWLATRNPKPPFLPSDESHASFASPEACLECHAPGGPSPQSANHPLGRECMRCHAGR